MGALFPPSHRAPPAGPTNDPKSLHSTNGIVHNESDSWLARRDGDMNGNGENALRTARTLQRRVGIDMEKVVYPELKGYWRKGLAYSQSEPHAKKFDGWLERNRRWIHRHHWNGSGNGGDINSDGSNKTVNGVDGIHTKEHYEQDDDEEDGSFPF